MELIWKLLVWVKQYYFPYLKLFKSLKISGAFKFILHRVMNNIFFIMYNARKDKKPKNQTKSFIFELLKYSILHSNRI